MKENVEKFFSLYNADAALKQRIKANEEEWLMLSEELEEEMRRQQEEAGL